MSKSSNKKIEELLKLSREKEALKAKEIHLITELDEQKKMVAVMFVDMVGSTEYKIKHTPDQWLLRLANFMGLVTTHIEDQGGTIAKYIGDEVMAYFEGETSADIARNAAVLLIRSMEKLSDADTDWPKAKIAIDYGNVHFLEYVGHKIPDPQGTTVDRCARIAAQTPGGGLLVSKYFRDAVTSKAEWKLVADAVPLKGIGKEGLYQLEDVGPKYIYIPVVELPEDDYIALTAELEAKKMVLGDYEDQNAELRETITKGGNKLPPKPGEASVVKFEDNPDVTHIKDIFRKVPTNGGQKILIALLKKDGVVYQELVDVTGAERADFTAIESEDYVFIDDDERYWINDDDAEMSELRGLIESVKEHYSSKPWSKLSFWTKELRH